MSSLSLMKALEEISELCWDVGLDVTDPDSEVRNLLYEIHTIASKAIEDERNEIDDR